MAGALPGGDLSLREDAPTRLSLEGSPGPDHVSGKRSLHSGAHPRGLVGLLQPGGPATSGCEALEVLYQEIPPAAAGGFAARLEAARTAPGRSSAAGRRSLRTRPAGATRVGTRIRPLWHPLAD